jgi:hypothetical protein
MPSRAAFPQPPALFDTRGGNLPQPKEFNVIDLTVYPETVDRNIAYCRDRGITLPTFAMMKDPRLVPASIKDTV